MSVPKEPAKPRGATESLFLVLCEGLLVNVESCMICFNSVFSNHLGEREKCWTERKVKKSQLSQKLWFVLENTKLEYEANHLEK